VPGPAKTPSALKLISGTARADREAPDPVDLPLVAEVPPAPDWLPNAHAVNEWNRLARILHANGMLTEPGLAPLGVMCSTFGDLVDIWAMRKTPPAHAIAQYRALANDFGLTPVAQGKVKASGEGSKSGGKFAGIGKRA
jgi:phage terminase small subunit